MRLVLFLVAAVLGPLAIYLMAFFIDYMWKGFIYFFWLESKSSLTGYALVGVTDLICLVLILILLPTSPHSGGCGECKIGFHYQLDYPWDKF